MKDLAALENGNENALAQIYTTNLNEHISKLCFSPMFQKHSEMATHLLVVVQNRVPKFHKF